MTNWTGFCMGEASTSADGKRLSFRRRTAQHSIYLADITAGGRSIDVPRQITPTKNKNYPGGWARDSKAIVFSSRGDGEWGIYKQQVDSDAPELLVKALPGYHI